MPLGTHERFIGFLIEHYAGNFPLWLAPEQVRVLTLNDEERLVAYAKGIIQQLRAEQVRVESDSGSDPIKAKIAEAEKARVHTMLVFGGPRRGRRQRKRAFAQQGGEGEGGSGKRDFGGDQGTSSLMIATLTDEGALW